MTRKAGGGRPLWGVDRTEPAEQCYSERDESRGLGSSSISHWSHS